jgi:hypothetical protein
MRIIVVGASTGTYYFVALVSSEKQRALYWL